MVYTERYRLLTGRFTARLEAEEGICEEVLCGYEDGKDFE